MMKLMNDLHALLGTVDIDLWSVRCYTDVLYIDLVDCDDWDAFADVVVALYNLLDDACLMASDRLALCGQRDYIVDGFVVKLSWDLD